MKNITVIKGDGIGPEVIDSALAVLEASGFSASYNYAEAGYDCFQKNKDSIPLSTVEACKKSDAVLFGAVTSPPNLNGYKSAIVTLRKELDVFANVRRVTSLPIANSRKNIDLIIVRENTEGMYSGIEEEFPDKVVAHRVVSRKASERIIRFAFKLCVAKGKKKVTLVHKANVLRKSDGLFRSIGLSIAKEFPSIELEEIIVDAMAMRLIKDPENFEVIVTTNLFGDILSDEATMLVGGMGVVGSASVGSRNGIFEPVHGSAPDIAGSGVANPTAAILSGALMLDYLGDSSRANVIRNAINHVFSKNLLTKDLGGSLSTAEFTEKVVEVLKK